jgi:phosphoglycolate phosphatase
MEAAMIKACIFDLDGTLTNTLDSLEYSVNETMKEIGMPQITKEQCRQFVGDGAKVLLERTLKAGGDTQLCHLEEAVEAYARIFDANCMYKVAPYEGIPQMLQQLKESGIKLAVLSNKPDRQAVHVVEEVFGKELFDHVQGQKDGVPKKPFHHTKHQPKISFDVFFPRQLVPLTNPAKKLLLLLFPEKWEL